MRTRLSSSAIDTWKTRRGRYRFAATPSWDLVRLERRKTRRSRSTNRSPGRERRRIRRSRGTKSERSSVLAARLASRRTAHERRGLMDRAVSWSQGQHRSLNRRHRSKGRSSLAPRGPAPRSLSPRGLRRSTAFTCRRRLSTRSSRRTIVRRGTTNRGALDIHRRARSATHALETRTSTPPARRARRIPAPDRSTRCRTGCRSDSRRGGDAGRRPRCARSPR